MILMLYWLILYSFVHHLQIAKLPDKHAGPQKCATGKTTPASTRRLDSIALSQSIFIFLLPPFSALLTVCGASLFSQYAVENPRSNKC